MEEGKASRREHWIYDRRAQLRFWRNVYENYGLDSEGVHRLLGVKSMYDWDKSEEEAYIALEEAGGDW